VVTINTKNKVLNITAVIFAVIAISTFSLLRQSRNRETQTVMAVEFMDHAAAAYVAQDKSWYEEQGLNLSSYTRYATGSRADRDPR